MLKCIHGNTVTVLHSAGGFYIGTLDSDGFPYCRMAEEYFKTEAAAIKALDKMKFTERQSMETLWCNENRGCRLTKV